jgi:hypothetical protein
VGSRQCVDIAWWVTGDDGDGGCQSDRYPWNSGIFGWSCPQLADLIETVNGVRSIVYPGSVNAPPQPCPLPNRVVWGYGTVYCRSGGAQGFRAAVTASTMPPGLADSSTAGPPSATVPEALHGQVSAAGNVVQGFAPAQVPTIEQEELLSGIGCASVPRVGAAGTPDEHVEWTPPDTKCVIADLPPLPATDGSGYENVGYLVRVVAHSTVASTTLTSTPGVLPAPVMAVTGSPGTFDAVAERVWFPYYESSIIEVNASGGSAMTLDIPGYVSVPMGRITIDNTNGDSIRMTGGVVAGRLVTDSDPRQPLPFGYVPSVIMQRTVRLVATAGNVTSTAIVKINSDTSYGIQRWVTQ